MVCLITWSEYRILASNWLNPVVSLIEIACTLYTREAPKLFAGEAEKTTFWYCLHRTRRALILPLGYITTGKTKRHKLNSSFCSSFRGVAHVAGST